MDPRPAYSIIDLLCCSVSLHLKGAWETQNHQTFCVSLVCLYHLQSCMSIISETLHDLTSEESLTDSKLPDTGYLRTKGQESAYETCACVIHTILLSYMCINIVSHFTLMFARGTCASSCFHVSANLVGCEHHQSVHRYCGSRDRTPCTVLTSTTSI